ncbi:FAD binding domain-containing protein [Aciditerrimonas ferrireducens]|uniref:FAD binding domain-containing protein n=1 Tax=Aciditerrimonas ferrireducens TaxID=667306 RepID=A0ABV6BZU9_9ACTN
MTVTVARSVPEALQALAADPPPEVLAGGTDFMVEVNFARRRPQAILAVSRIDALGQWQQRDGQLRLGAGVTYTQLLEPPLAELAPALAQAARTVGSPQIRNAGTIGGNLVTASPAGDTLPVLLALDAEVELASAQGTRTLPLEAFLLGPKRCARRPDELLVAVRFPAPFGRQEFVKVGTRNAMVIAVASACVVLDPGTGQVRIALGSVGPTPLRARAAEAYLAEQLVPQGTGPADTSAFELRDGEAALAEVRRLVAEAAQPIDDHRSSAAYRRHAVGVCVARALERLLRPAPGAALGEVAA